MPVPGIDNNLLNKKLVPKLRKALKSADRNGIHREKLEAIMVQVLGFTPDDGQFGKIMWVVHYQTGTNGLYYKPGKVPQEYLKPDKPIKQEAPAKKDVKTDKSQSKTYEGVTKIRIEQGNVITIIKNAGTVIIPAVLGVLLIVGSLLGWI